MKKNGNVITLENISNSLEWKILEEIIILDAEMFYYKEIEEPSSEKNLRRNFEADGAYKLFEKIVYNELTYEEKVVFLQYLDYLYKIEQSKENKENKYFEYGLSDMIDTLGPILMDEINDDRTLNEFMTDITAKTK